MKGCTETSYFTKFGRHVAKTYEFEMNLAWGRSDFLHGLQSDPLGDLAWGTRFLHISNQSDVLYTKALRTSANRGPVEGGRGEVNLSHVWF